MRTALRSPLFVVVVLCTSGLAAAQAPITEAVYAPGAFVTDDGYDGTLASMGCAVHDFSGTVIDAITDVEVSVGIDQEWIGDLTIKVVSPSGEVLTALSRPGLAAPDDGSGCCGNSSDIARAFPVTFGDRFTDDAETMGDSLLTFEVVCEDDDRCDYAPSPDGGPGTSFAQYAGEDPAGTWMVCVGDGAAGDPTAFIWAIVYITGTVGTPVCEQDLTATLDDPNPAPGQIVTFAVTVTNDDDAPAPLDLWLDAAGPANRTLRLGSGTLPAGAAVTRNVRVRVPDNAPQGTYGLALNIGQFPDDVCDAVDFEVTVGSAPRPGAPNEVKAEVAGRIGVTAPPRPDVQFEVVEGFFAAGAATPAPQVAPNPFARQTTISYEVAAASDVRLAVYDVLGREVAVLVDARQEAGVHRATFDASGLAAGTYVYRLVVGSEVQTGRLTLAN